MKQDLEIAVESKIKPLVDETVHKYLGVHLRQIQADISDKLKKQPLLDYPISIHISFKKAKKAFKKYFLSKLLHLNAGNISEAAKQAGIDRRSLHRLLNELKVSAEGFRRDQSYARQTAVQQIIHKTLEVYKPALHPAKFKQLYEHSGELSKDIAKELPEQALSLKQAEQEFEKVFIKKALEEYSGSTTKTAKAIGLTFEHLHRKIKALGLEMAKNKRIRISHNIEKNSKQKRNI